MSDVIDISAATRGDTATAEPAAPASDAFNDAFASLAGMADVPEGAAGGSSSPPSPSSKSSAAAPPTSGSSSKPSAATPTAKPATPAADTSTSGKPGSADPKSSATPAEPKPGDKPADDIPPEKMAPKQLREQYTRAKARLKELEAKLGELSAAKPADQPDIKALQEKLTAREQELNALSDRIKLADYEKSEEYKQKYWEPFVETFNAGRELVQGMTITDGEGNQRQGTASDFDALMKITDPNRLAEVVEEMFGAVKGAEVMAARREVLAKNKARDKALKDYKELSTQRQKQGADEIKTRRETWSQLNAQAAEKFPQWFKPTEGDGADPKANELLQKGMELADYAFSDAIKPEDMVPVHSAIRNKAGAFDRVVYELQRERAARKELEKKLEEIESSAPGGGIARRAAPAQDSSDTMEGALNRLGSLAG